VQDELKKYRQFLIDTQIKLNESYDKLIISLSGGALALSITFLKNVIENKEINYPALLLIAWALFVCSLAAILCSILFGIQAYKKAILQVDDESIYDKETTGGKSSKLSSVMHWIAAISLLIGLVFISTFTYFNIGEKNGRKEITTKATSETVSKTTEKVTATNSSEKR